MKRLATGLHIAVAALAAAWVVYGAITVSDGRGLSGACHGPGANRLLCEMGGSLQVAGWATIAMAASALLLHVVAVQALHFGPAHVRAIAHAVVLAAAVAGPLLVGTFVEDEPALALWWLPSLAAALAGLGVREKAVAATPPAAGTAG